MLNLSSVLRAFLLTHLIKFLLFIYIPYLKCYIYLNLQTIIDYSVVFILINHSSLYFLGGGHIGCDFVPVHHLTLLNII